MITVIILSLAQVLYENYYNPRNTAIIPGVPTLASITKEPPHKELPPIPPDDDVPSSGVEGEILLLLY